MKLVTNRDTPWTCLKAPNADLVYWVHSKCACSFYKPIFKQLGWVDVTITDINWEHDTVFSYIRDPLIKHRIGIIEWFHYNNCRSLLEENFNNTEFFTMLANIAYLDWHSMSIEEHLGQEKSSKITWIPIDQPGVNHVQETIDLIERQTTVPSDIKHLMLNTSPVNASKGFKKQCNQKLLDIAPSPLIIKSIEYDRWLYDTVTKKNFEPENYTQRIEYLKRQGLTQQEAELNADQDVQTGNYLNWDKE